MDYPVKARSDTEIRRLAARLLDHYGVSNRDRVDVIACLWQDTIWTARGKKRLIYDIRPDSEMGSDDATTAYAKGIVTIAVKRSVHEAALMGEGRARLTLAHELGHAVLHEGAPKARGTGAAGQTRPKWLKAYESAERQANVFAVALLINDAVSETLPNAEEISVRFGVSLKCAQICFEGVRRRLDRAASAERVSQKAAAFRQEEVPDPVRPRYLNETCTGCGKQTLYPLGTKCKCRTCGSVTDRFQDGDSCDP